MDNSQVLRHLRHVSSMDVPKLQEEQRVAETRLNDPGIKHPALRASILNYLCALQLEQEYKALETSEIGIQGPSRI